MLSCLVGLSTINDGRWSNPSPTWSKLSGWKMRKFWKLDMCHVCCFDGRCQNQGFGFGIRAPPLLYNVLVIWKGDGKRLKYVYIYIYQLLKKKWLVAPFQSDTQRAMITELFEGFKSTLSQISRQVSPTCEWWIFWTCSWKDLEVERIMHSGSCRLV